MIDWLTGLNVEQICVLTYMIIIGITYGFETTLLYLQGITTGRGVSNNFAGVTVLLSWYFSIVYWFIF